MEKINQGLIKPNKWLKFCKKLTGGIMLSAAFCLWSGTASAESLSLISDEESEQLLAKITRPLFRAAGINYDRNKVFIVDDPSLNAFVSDGNTLYIHTGTILAADSVNELSGVIAHETGHIMGGHILRQKLKNQEMSEVTLASAILAGTAAAVSGRGDAAMAVMLGAQSSALSHYTIYRTEQERSADESAMKLLSKTGQSPKGMLAFMKKISQRNTLNGIDETPYFRTHPVTRERISYFEDAVKASPYRQDNTLDEEFARVKAKLFAYLRNPQETLRRYFAPDDTAAQYARAVAAFKQLKFAKAEAEIKKLIQKEPQNPYFHELLGQIYLETGKIKPAKREYEQALNLMPSSALLQVSAAQVILEDTPSPSETAKAVSLLNKALIARPSSYSWMLLSRAYGLQGKEAAASYAAAEYSLRTGELETAKRQARQAKTTPHDAKLALKIDDLLLRIKEIERKK